MKNLIIVFAVVALLGSCKKKQNEPAEEVPQPAQVQSKKYVMSSFGNPKVRFLGVQSFTNGNQTTYTTAVTNVSVSPSDSSSIVLVVNDKTVSTASNFRTGDRVAYRFRHSMGTTMMVGGPIPRNPMPTNAIYYIPNDIVIVDSVGIKTSVYTGTYSAFGGIVQKQDTVLSTKVGTRIVTVKEWGFTAP